MPKMTSATRQVADVHLALEHGVGDRAADHRRGDVVEEAREQPHQHQQHEAALPVVGQEPRQHRRHLALLEQVGQQREAEQQQQQVRQDHPLMPQVQHEAAESGAALERRQHDLVQANQYRAAERDAQGVVVEQRHAGKHQAEQDELDRHRPERRTCEPPVACRRRGQGRQCRCDGSDHLEHSPPSSHPVRVAADSRSRANASLTAAPPPHSGKPATDQQALQAGTPHHRGRCGARAHPAGRHAASPDPARRSHATRRVLD
jgi:hypothetical protein